MQPKRRGRPPYPPGTPKVPKHPAAGRAPADDLYLTESYTGQPGTAARDPTDIRLILGLDEVKSPNPRQSSIGHLVSCPRFYLLRDRVGLQRRHYKSAASVGTMVHLITAARLTGCDELNVEKRLAAFVSEQVKSLLDHGRETQTLEVATRQCDRVREDAVLAKTLADIYWKRFPLKMADWDVIVVEKSFSVRVPESKCSIDGTVDLLLYHKKLKGYFLVDHKTTSLSPRTWAGAIAYDLQVRMYRLAVARLLATGELGVRGSLLGFVHNVIRRPKIALKQDQTPEEYLAELEDWFDAKDDEVGTLDENGEAVVFKSGPRKGLKKPRWEHAKNALEWKEDPPLNAFVTRFAGDPLDQELKVTLSWAGKASRALPLLENYPRLGVSTGQCTRHYGQPCEFLPFCQTDPCNWRKIKELHFEIQKSDEPDEEAVND